MDRRTSEQITKNIKVCKSGEFFKVPEAVRHDGYEALYDKLLKENTLFFQADLIKSKLKYSYSLRDIEEIESEIDEIIGLYEADGNKHFQ